MKKLTKIVSLLFAVVMLVALGVTAAAVDNGTITVASAKVGETYSIYKMLDMTYNTNSGSYVYTIATGWEDFFPSTGAGSAYVSVDDTSGAVSWSAGTDSTGSQRAAFAKAALAYAQSASLSADDSEVAASTTVEFKGLSYGYYLVDSTLGSLCSLDSTDPDAEVEDKNPTPTVSKTVQEDSTGNYETSNTADTAEVVYFRTEIASAHNAASLILHDVMDSGFSLNENSFEIKYGSSLASADSTVDSSYYTISFTSLKDNTCTFEISFEDEFTATLTNSQVIVITYNATVNTNAVIGSTGNENTTYVTYGENQTSEESTTTTYVYDLYIYKYATKDTSEVRLADAKFIIYKTVGTTNYYAVLDTNNNVSSWTTTEGNATVLTTDSTGIVHFSGLDSGSYYIKETEAPDGYSVLAAPVDAEIDSNDGTVTGAVSVTLTEGGTNYVDAIKIENNSGSEMPSTGGIGTTIFYVVGGILVVGAVVLLITRRRMKNSK